MCAYMSKSVQVYVGAWHQDGIFIPETQELWQPVAPSSVMLSIAL